MKIKKICQQCGGSLSIGKGSKIGICLSCLYLEVKKKSELAEKYYVEKIPKTKLPKMRKIRIQKVEPGKWWVDFTFKKYRITKYFYGKKRREVIEQINQIRRNIEENIYRKKDGGEPWRIRNAMYRGFNNAYNLLYRQFVRTNFPEIDKLIKAKILQSEIRRSLNV